MNTRKFEILMGILATILIALGLFFAAIREPSRITSAQESQIMTDLDEAMTLYAQNCSVCHGLAGEGIGAMPALDSSALRQADYDSLSKIIARGLFGTAMPAWSKEDGGPLNDYQIGELVTLIRYGTWQETQERVVNLGLAPLVPFTTEPDPALLQQVSALPGGEELARGITLYAGQCVACHGADGLGTALAPALNDPSVREKSPEELERTILSGVPGTLMAAWNSVLSEQDITDLVTLIDQWDQVPSGAIPAPDKPVPVTEESLALGADLYAQNCSRCHGPDGQGTQRAPSLNVKGYLAEMNDAALQQVITLGVPGTAMPSWGDRMSEAEIQAVVGFMRAWEPTAPEVAEPARGGGGAWWKSGGNTSSGGKGGGPPWMRDSNSAQPGAQVLPSGGSAPATATPAGPAVAGPPEGAGTGQLGTRASELSQSSGDSPQGAGAGLQGTSAMDQVHTGGGPPWAQESQQPSWWELLDRRILAFVLGGLILAITLVGVAVTGLARLASSENRAGT